MHDITIALSQPARNHVDGHKDATGTSQARPSPLPAPEGNLTLWSPLGDQYLHFFFFPPPPPVKVIARFTIFFSPHFQAAGGERVRGLAAASRCLPDQTGKKEELHDASAVCYRAGWKVVLNHPDILNWKIN